MFLNKKGISPLIATVLLIGFTVALAAVVIIWGSGFVSRTTVASSEKTAQTLACTSDLNFDIRKVNCDDNGVDAGGVSKITIDNKGSYAIKKIIFRSFDKTGKNKDVIEIQSVPATMTINRQRFRVSSGIANSRNMLEGISPQPPNSGFLNGPSDSGEAIDFKIGSYEIKEISLIETRSVVWKQGGQSVGNPVVKQKLSVGVTRVEAIATINVEGVNVTCAEAVKQRLFTPSC